MQANFIIDVVEPSKSEKKKLNEVTFQTNNKGKKKNPFGCHTVILHTKL